MVQENMEHPFLKYLRSAMIPHIWCPGCGNGIVLNSLVHAIDELQMDLDNLVVVSGIGCIGRTAGYTNTDSFHTTHGRSLAFATGVKLANPELDVVIVSGDGDLFAIGGNHFIHAARRNMGLKVICANNFNYGMTGGQQGPTTPLESLTTTSPHGNIEHPFNLVHLAAASGATYVARWTTLHVRRLTHSIKKVLQKEGFCFIEVISPCPEIFGRYNRMRSGLEMMEWFKKASVVDSFSDPAKAEITPERIVVGEFVDVEKLSYEKLLHEKISKINEKAMEQMS
ncbi:2-oxoacid:ferredoxin oxidoreductase subunit beta [Candidatus Bathyarchaeota archaeon]|jgi:2-oxoglutarate ferredoxin oxidoreductase subunit beta|nr:2-oxoacid:ferredoxin oxidoreductase subunit beta [Candidatus Bathyarchaeota archaeon]